MEKVIDEGAKAFDSERFDTPFPEYIDELILGHDSAGKLTSTRNPSILVIQKETPPFAEGGLSEYEDLETVYGI